MVGRSTKVGGTTKGFLWRVAFSFQLIVILTHESSDERLEFLLIIRMKDTSQVVQKGCKVKPPCLLLSFLNHLQVSIDASYISPIATDSPIHGHPPVPIRTTSINKEAPGLRAPVQLLPPQTPRPMPKSDEPDEIYANAEGTMLKSFIWGDDLTELDDSFRLLWSERDREWVAVYRLNMIVCE